MYFYYILFLEYWHLFTVMESLNMTAYIFNFWNGTQYQKTLITFEPEKFLYNYLQ